MPQYRSPYQAGAVGSSTVTAPRLRQAPHRLITFIANKPEAQLTQDEKAGLVELGKAVARGVEGKSSFFGFYGMPSPERDDGVASVVKASVIAAYEDTTLREVFETVLSSFSADFLLQLCPSVRCEFPLLLEFAKTNFLHEDVAVNKEISKTASNTVEGKTNQRHGGRYKASKRQRLEFPTLSATFRWSKMSDVNSALLEAIHYLMSIPNDKRSDETYKGEQAVRAAVAPLLDLSVRVLHVFPGKDRTIETNFLMKLSVFDLGFNRNAMSQRTLNELRTRMGFHYGDALIITSAGR